MFESRRRLHDSLAKKARTKVASLVASAQHDLTSLLPGASCVISGVNTPLLSIVVVILLVVVNLTSDLAARIERSGVDVRIRDPAPDRRDDFAQFPGRDLLRGGGGRDDIGVRDRADDGA